MSIVLAGGSTGDVNAGLASESLALAEPGREPTFSWPVGLPVRETPFDGDVVLTLGNCDRPGCGCIAVIDGCRADSFEKTIWLEGGGGGGRVYGGGDVLPSMEMHLRLR